VGQVELKEQLLNFLGRFLLGMAIPLVILYLCKRYGVRDRRPATVYTICALIAGVLPFVGVSEPGKVVLAGLAALVGVVYMFVAYGKTMQRLALTKHKRRRKGPA
jgi:uncharacterized membrane protein YtjA (UPF0391 family)